MEFLNVIDIFWILDDIFLKKYFYRRFDIFSLLCHPLPKKLQLLYFAQTPQIGLPLRDPL